MFASLTLIRVRYKLVVTILNIPTKVHVMGNLPNYFQLGWISDMKTMSEWDYLNDHFPTLSNSGKGKTQWGWE